MATEENQEAQQRKDNRRKKQRNVGQGRQALGVVTVFGLNFLFFFYVTLFHRLQLQRTGSDHFEVGATLRARNDFALIDFFFFHIQIGFAFRTKHHDASTPFDISFVIR
jgi:hypothetical protein